ncbi:MAG: ATP-binding protein [Gemmatimonadaceae bacterium]
MDPLRQPTVTDARESASKGRDTGASRSTESIASRDVIERERQKYFELFEMARDACFLTDSEGVIREANAAAAQILGVAAHFLPGKPLPAFFEESARETFRHQLDQLDGSTHPDEWEIKLAPRNGMPVHVSVSVARVGNEDVAALYRWVVRDTSRQKRAEASAREEAEVSHRVKSEFLSLLSHEFRTPLQAIFGYTELLEREIHGPLNESQRGDLLRIQQSQQHLLSLINTILDFAKLESGQTIDLSLEPTVLHDVLAQMEGVIGAQLEQKQLLYAYKCSDRSIIADVDAVKLKQIILNLLSNAVRFTDRGGSITIESEIEGEYVLVRVTDTGKGIPPDKLVAIFLPFVQIKSKGSVSTGTGLGLPIGRKLATAMGGSLDGTSEVGKGSTFTLRLKRSKIGLR